MGWRTNPDRASHFRPEEIGGSGTTAPFGFRNGGRFGWPRTTARHDEAHVARGRAHQGRKTTRTPRQIEDHEVGPLPAANRAGADRIGETSSQKVYFENRSSCTPTVARGGA